MSGEFITTVMLNTSKTHNLDVFITNDTTCGSFVNTLALANGLPINTLVFNYVNKILNINHSHSTPSKSEPCNKSYQSGLFKRINLLLHI